MAQTIYDPRRASLEEEYRCAMSGARSAGEAAAIQRHFEREFKKGDTYPYRDVLQDANRAAVAQEKPKPNLKLLLL